MDERCKECEAKCCKSLIYPVGMNDRIALEWCKARELTVCDGYVIVPHRCPQLGEDNRCRIYDKRPLSCAMWRVGGHGCNLVRKSVP